uniref:RanBP2-type domain-containing protein n=1 Tax=Macrostomum lignano TaxID=282301 RepID=A0A1I8FJB6_9PLAT
AQAAAAHLGLPRCAPSGTGGADRAAKCAATERARIGAPRPGRLRTKKAAAWIAESRLDSGAEAHNEGLFRVLRGRCRLAETAAAAAGGQRRRICYSRDFLLSCRTARWPPGSPGLPRELLAIAVAGVTSQMNYAAAASPSCHLRARKRPPRGPGCITVGRKADSRATGDRRSLLRVCSSFRNGSSSSVTRRSAWGGARQLPLFSLRAYAEPEGAATILRTRRCWFSACLPPAIQRCMADGQLLGNERIFDELTKTKELKVLTYLVTSNPEHWPPKKDHLEQLKAAVRAERDRQVILRRGDPNTMKALQDLGRRRPQQPEVEEEPGWSCPKCTFRNEPVRPGCQMCGGARPPDYELTLRRRALRNPKTAAAAADSSSSDSDDEENKADEPREAADPYGERERNFRELNEPDAGSLIPVPAQQGFECPICLCDVGGDDDDGDGIRACGCASAAT